MEGINILLKFEKIKKKKNSQKLQSENQLAKSAQICFELSSLRTQSRNHSSVNLIKYKTDCLSIADHLKIEIANDQRKMMIILQILGSAEMQCIVGRVATRTEWEAAGFGWDPL